MADYPHEKSKKVKQLPVGVTTLPQQARSSGAWPGMVDYLAARGLSLDIAVDNGWYPSMSAGDSYLRIVMPATNTKGYVYWQARAIDPSVEKRYQSPAYASSDSIIIVWPTGQFPRRAVLVEGPMDALAAAGCGHVGIAVMGKSPQPEVYDHIASLFKSYTFQVVPDADDLLAGTEMCANLITRGIRTSLVLGTAKDLAAASREDREAILG